MRHQVGVIYGKVASTSFDLAVGDPGLRRLDYVEVQEDGRRVLAQVDTLERRSSLSFEDAMAIPEGYAADAEDKVAASVRVIGYRDSRGLVQVPRTPFRAGTPVYRADASLVAVVMGLEAAEEGGAFLGHVKGSRIPVHLSMDVLAQKHLSVLAKTGAGKSYTVGVVLEEFLKAGVPLVILDPHGEYGSLRHPNMEDTELDAMVRFGIKPRAFHRQIQEYALDTQLNPEAQRLVLEGMNLEGREIVDMLGGSLSGGQVGVLYQAIKEVKDHLPAYTIRDVMDAVGRNKSNAKWNVLNALEVLESTKIFDIRGTPVTDLVQPGRCTIVNLKGVSPDIQDIVVTRITGMLWQARKRGDVPAHILVVEEAHNFCPERNVGNAISGAVLRTVASEGRKFGMGLVIVSQRPAKIDKNVLSQCNTQLVLKVTNPNDLKAIGQSVENITPETQDEIQRLPIGVALVAGGGLTQPLFVDVRPRMTRHGGRSVSVLAPAADEKEVPRIPFGQVAGSGAPERADAPTPEGPAPWPQAATAPAETGSEPVPPAAAAFPPAPTAFPPVPPAIASASPGRADIDWLEPATTPLPPARALLPDTDTLETPVQDLPPRRAPTVEDLAKRNGVSAPSTRFIAQPVRPRTASRVEEPAPRVWSAKDKAAIHRVASRIGIVASGLPPDEAVETIARIARGNGRRPDDRLALYHDIAQEACLEDRPLCVRCPLSAQCLHHRSMQEERQNTRSPIRRLWTR